MNFKSLLNSLFFSPDSTIFLSIFGVYVSVALIIILLFNTPRLRSFFSSFDGFKGTFYSPAASMFALLAAFMGATLINAFNTHTESINQERTALLLYVDFVNNTPPISQSKFTIQSQAIFTVGLG
jgi:uncharacterized membrane protein YdfJ with MMPL/SSD domain